MTALSRAAVQEHQLNDWLDADGRPIGEFASRERYLACLDEVRCPYPGSRRGMPMNRGALRQMMSCWPALCGTVCALSVPGATVHGAWRVTTAATIAPLLLPRPTPRLYAALYKATIGFHQCLTFLLLGGDEVADLPLAALAEAEDFGVWLEREGWLVGHSQGCAGPMRLIHDLYRALCGQGCADDDSGWDAIDGWAAATGQAMRWQDEALRERIADSDPKPTFAPWLVTGTLRPEQVPGDVARLWPSARRCRGE